MRRYCVVPGCSNYQLPGSRQARCRPHQQLYDRAKNQKRVAYRTTAWQKLPRAGLICVDCGSTRDITIDHVIERHKGGTNAINNLAPRCRSCNSRKSNAERRSID